MRIETLADGVTLILDGSTDIGGTRIYTLCEYPSMAPRYVGKTVRSLAARIKQHRRAARNAHLPVWRWLAKRSIAGQQVCIKWLETVPPLQDWAARERYWILKHRQEGAALLNLTDGGEGLAGHVFSESHKAKIAKALRTGSECQCLKCGAMFWGKKNQIAKGDAKYCSKRCYQEAQVGKSKMSVVPASAIIAAARAKNAMTHCKRSHPLSGENVFITTMGGRGCKECRKIHKANYRERAK